MECIWINGDPDHSGNIETKPLFKGQINVAICEKHYKEHLVIMALIKTGVLDAEQVMSVNSEERKKLLKSKVYDVDVALKEAEQSDNEK